MLPRPHNTIIKVIMNQFRIHLKDINNKIEMIAQSDTKNQGKNLIIHTIAHPQICRVSKYQITLGIPESPPPKQIF